METCSAAVFPRKRRTCIACCLLAIGMLLNLMPRTVAQQSSTTFPAGQSDEGGEPLVSKETKPPIPHESNNNAQLSGEKPLPKKLEDLLSETTALNPQKSVFIDLPGNRVVLKTDIACRTCILEMLCVPQGVKEHETILRIQSLAYVIHTALLALGLEAGTPVKYSPKFVAPSGHSLSIYASWVDEDGMLQRKDVRTWIRHNIHRYYAWPLPTPPPGLKLPYKELRYDKFNNELLWYGPMTEADRDDLLSKWDDERFQDAIHSFYSESKSRQMSAEFVFVGSQFFKDPETGKQSYQAEGGYLICVANFNDAMIDIREESSANDGAQAYEAWTENIPPEGTPVLLEIVPVKRTSTTGPKNLVTE